MNGGVAADVEAVAVERVFRQAHGQAVATLVRIFGDITLAEDAVQEAFVAASDPWRSSGIPPNPAGWIVTTARNRAIDDLRRSARGRALHEQLGAVTTTTDWPGTEEWGDDGPVRDDQLRLILTCCHPALRTDHAVAWTPGPHRAFVRNARRTSDSDWGFRHGAGDKNRTRMTSLEGICTCSSRLGCAF
jgi:predicted RNA polymerase sigma factor